MSAQKRRFLAALTILAVIWIAAGIAPTAAQSRDTADDITAVKGPSQLRRLGLTVLDSAMGSTGRWGALPVLVLPVTNSSTQTLGMAGMTLTGEDLYRLNCRACHRADGAGSPSEINSIIDPVRSMAPHVVRERMRVRGTPISAEFARELALGSRQDVLERLQHGGDRMPAMLHLGDAEINALLAYLEALAGVPGASGRQLRINVPAMRIGEHLVKGTCHICHDAVGRWPGPEALMEGVVPSLESLVRQRGVASVIGKVRQGGTVMNSLGLTYRGRMPEFSYLTEAEIAAAYQYLVRYPPQPGAR